MMTDEQIRKAALAIAVIGIAGIALVSQYTGPENVAAGEITEAKIGRLIEVSGNITSYSTKDGHVFLDLADETGTINIVMFERTARSQKEVYDLNEGDSVTVTGKVLLYRSEIEVQADSIKSI